MNYFGWQITRMAQTCALTSGQEFSLLAGSGALILPTMAMGGVGAIAGLANVLGAEMCGLYRLCMQEKWAEAVEVQRALVQPNIVVSTFAACRIHVTIKVFFVNFNEKYLTKNIFL